MADDCWWSAEAKRCQKSGCGIKRGPCPGYLPPLAVQNENGMIVRFVAGRDPDTHAPSGSSGGKNGC